MPDQTSVERMAEAMRVERDRQPLRPFMTEKGGKTCSGGPSCLHYTDQLVTIYAEAADTGGAYGLFTGEVPKGSGPPPHIHSKEDEAFLITTGRLHAWVGEEFFDVRPGSFVFLPKGMIHWFEAVADEPTTIICIVSPGGHESMFRALGTPASSPQLPAPWQGEWPIMRIIAEAARVGVTVDPTHNNWHLAKAKKRSP